MLDLCFDFLNQNWGCFDFIDFCFDFLYRCFDFLDLGIVFLDQNPVCFDFSARPMFRLSQPKSGLFRLYWLLFRLPLPVFWLSWFRYCFSGPKSGMFRFSRSTIWLSRSVFWLPRPKLGRFWVLCLTYLKLLPDSGLSVEGNSRRVPLPNGDLSDPGIPSSDQPQVLPNNIIENRLLKLD